MSEQFKYCKVHKTVVPVKGCPYCEIEQLQSRIDEAVAYLEREYPLLVNNPNTDICRVLAILKGES